MPPIIADTLGGIPAAYALDQNMRRADAAQLMAQFSQLAQRRQEIIAQQNWEKQQAMAQANTAAQQDYQNRNLALATQNAKDALGLENRKLQMTSDWYKHQEAQPAKADPEAMKERLDALGLATSTFEKRANETGDVDTTSPLFKSFSPERQQAIMSEATATQQRLAPVIGRTLNLAQAWNEKLAVDKQIEEISKSKPGLLTRAITAASFDANTPVTAYDKAMADMKQRSEALAKALENTPAPGTPGAAGLFQRNLETGTVEPAVTIPDWFKRQLSLPVNPAEYGRLPVGRSGAPAQPTAPNPRALNIQMPATGTNAPAFSAPPQAMTGTNRPAMPPLIRQNGVLFRLVNGQYEPTQ